MKNEKNIPEFHAKNPLYYSSNKELYRPEPECEEDSVGQLHTATCIIAEVKDEEGAQEIVKKVAIYDQLVETLQLISKHAPEMGGDWALMKAQSALEKLKK